MGARARVEPLRPSAGRAAPPAGVDRPPAGSATPAYQHPPSRKWALALLLVAAVVALGFVFRMVPGADGAAAYLWLTALGFGAAVVIPHQALTRPRKRRLLLGVAWPSYVSLALVMSALGYQITGGLTCQITALCRGTVSFGDALYYAVGAFLGSGADGIIVPQGAGRVIAVADRLLGWLSLGIAIAAVTVQVASDSSMRNASKPLRRSAPHTD